MAQSPDNYLLKPPSIMVDDSDPAVQYNGAWRSANGTEILTTDFSERMPIFSTLHVLKTFNGSFSYDFIGWGISVFATPVDGTNYTSQCFVDGNEVPFNASVVAQFGQSQPVCQAFGLLDNTNHTISVNVSVPAREQQDENGDLSGFAFDYMLIQPISSVSPWDNGTQDVLLPILDTSNVFTTDQPTIDFGIFLDEPSGQIANVDRDWIFDPENGFRTTTWGSQLNLTFTGTSLLWYGYPVPGNGGNLPGSSVTFSVDGAAPSGFSSVHVPPSSSQELLFRTPVLPYARHALTVVHYGTNETSPLTLQLLVIQKSTSTVTSFTPTVSSSTVGLLTSTTPTFPIPPASYPTSKPEKRGVIVGGIAAGVVFLLFAAFGVYILARRARRSGKFMEIKENNTAVVAVPFPPSMEETVRTFAPKKAQPGYQNIVMQQELQSPPVTKWTRRHTISDSSGPLLGSFTARKQQNPLPGSRTSHPPIQGGSQLRPTNTNSFSEQRSAPICNPFNDPATPNLDMSHTSPEARGARQEDSGFRVASAPDLPPLYTID